MKLRTLRFRNMLQFMFNFIHYMRNYFPENPTFLLLVHEIWSSSPPFTHNDVYLSTSLTSPIDGGELSVSRPCRFTPWGRTLSLTRWIRMCGFQRKKKHLARARIIISDLPTHILVNKLTTISQLPYARHLVIKFAAEEVQARWSQVTLSNTSQLSVLSNSVQGRLREHFGIPQLFLSLKIIRLGIILSSHYTLSLTL